MLVLVRKEIRNLGELKIADLPGFPFIYNSLDNNTCQGCDKCIFYQSNAQYEFGSVNVINAVAKVLRHLFFDTHTFVEIFIFNRCIHFNRKLTGALLH